MDVLDPSPSGMAVTRSMPVRGSISSHAAKSTENAFAIDRAAGGRGSNADMIVAKVDFCLQRLRSFALINASVQLALKGDLSCMVGTTT